MKGGLKLFSIKKTLTSLSLALVPIAGTASPVSAVDLTDKVSFNGVLAGIYQHQAINDIAGFKDTGRGAMVFQPEVHVALTPEDEIQAKFGFAAGNALNDGTAPFHLASWAADLEADAKDINGRERDYLLTAWYKHSFDFGPENTLGISVGIIDAAEFLDENAYAGDEYNQFMNAALVHKVHDFFPSYDLGAAVEWERGRFTVKGVAMTVGADSDEQHNFDYYGAQLGYRLQTPLGEGHYRLILDRTSSDFTDINDRPGEAMAAAVLSCDQQLGDILGLWLRLGRQSDDAAIHYRDLFSGGLDIKGTGWGRPADNVGLGYALMNEGNLEIDKSQVLEAYYRLAINNAVSFTLDAQYMQDNLREADNRRGWIIGSRLTASF
jgi:hypothetical protein